MRRVTWFFCFAQDFVHDLAIQIGESLVASMSLQWNAWLAFLAKVGWCLGGGFIFFFNFQPYLGKWSNLTNIFQMGWNHQLGVWKKTSEELPSGPYFFPIGHPLSAGEPCSNPLGDFTAASPFGADHKTWQTWTFDKLGLLDVPLPTYPYGKSEIPI